MGIENLVAGKSNIFWDAWRAGYVGADAAINSALLTEQDRWPLWIPVLFGIGVAIYFTLPIEPPYWLGLLSIIVAASCLWVHRGTSRVPDSSWSCHGCRKPCHCSGAHLLGNRANPRTCRTIGPCQRSRAEHRKLRAGHSNLTRRSHTYRAGCDGEANEHLAEEDPHNSAWVIWPATR